MAGRRFAVVWPSRKIVTALARGWSVVAVQARRWPVVLGIGAILGATIVLTLHAGERQPEASLSPSAAAADLTQAAVEGGEFGAEASPAIMATGTVKPSLLVEVGTQLSGTLTELLVEFNDPVRKGQALARLEPETFAANAREAAAALSVARAQAELQAAAVTRAEAVARMAASDIASAEARLEGARAQLARSNRDLDRKAALAERGNLSRSELDRARTDVSLAAALVKETAAALQADHAKVATAEAELAMAKSQLLVTEATVTQRQAAVDRAEVDLERSVIRSPIDGLVIDRKIDVGQTVAASLNAPTLFTIARDLSEIEVHASVDEADVGQVRVDQAVQFTVDAYPERRFEGQVRQIRKSPILIQNVVTYTIVIGAENRDRVLFPGMTALVTIAVGENPPVEEVPKETPIGAEPYLSSSAVAITR